MSLRVLLAGYNVDADILRDLRRELDLIQNEAGAGWHEDLSAGELRRLLETIHHSASDLLSNRALTPEVLSAAYARISRDPKSIPELRRVAREGIAAARKSNEAIIFGMGHASVAEHAVFNLDILGLSRLATEELQAHRLLSFTEKSQRYVTAESDYVVPQEICGTDWEERFHTEVGKLFSSYRILFEKLLQRITADEGEATENAARREQETRAKEDARYVLPLATATQMGMTVSARNLEYVVRECAGHELAEMRLLGQALCEAVHPLAPSLVKYVRPSEFPRWNRCQIAGGRMSESRAGDLEILTGPEAKLLLATPDAERVVAQALAFQSGGRIAEENLPSDFWHTVFRGMTQHDPAPREFELATLQFEVRLSASCYAQFKRHRMMTLLPAPYCFGEGVILPPAIEQAGLSQPFADIVCNADEFCRKLAPTNSHAARYLLTNAHSRRAVVHLNARELYHMARLRQDKQAQWEIRRLVSQMVGQARQLWPNLMALACGKDEFDKRYERFFGEKH
ncbi:MAG: FAD-dependent thymidylate synthase [Calditrichaeota bacterium]|nr:FAD-dependent thymidylate synthase [Calditrichota bacterium]